MTAPPSVLPAIEPLYTDSQVAQMLDPTGAPHQGAVDPVRARGWPTCWHNNRRQMAIPRLITTAGYCGG